MKMNPSNGNLLQQWISDFCAPVVVVIATEEAERICLQNGLLMHELLSCFGQIDSVNATIRIGTQAINISDGHLRFERGTETKSKTPEVVEELLQSTFKPYNINYLPVNTNEIKVEPPTAWTRDVEQIFSRSMSFHESEMISHPVLILNVVATTDQEPVVAMQELSSIHHTPSVFTNGQYDNTIHRVFVLLEDAANRKKDPLSILRGLNSHFPPAHTKLLSINSFPASAPNLQQPDMWSKNLIPKYFRNNAPTVTETLPINPMSNSPVLGCRLSVEDFMKLREFCIWLFNDQVLPVLERRLTYLTHKVNDSRKGVKNVLKSFWRRPREENDGGKGSVKYRFDKIESQTLLLADLSFCLRDYETASSMYRLVREDYKSDKSNLHYTHTLLMSAICQILTEPHKAAEIFQTVSNIGQVMQGGFETPVAHGYFALLCAEIYNFHPHSRSPLDAAKILLQAAASLSRYPLMSSLLTERAAGFYLQANQVRKYVLHSVITSIKMHRMGKYLPSVHATTCFAAAMLLLEKGSWADLKSKLSKAIADDFKLLGREGAQRSLLFLLKILYQMIQDSKDISINSSLVDAVSILNEVLGDGAWGAIRINEGWMDCSVRDIMLGSLPIGPLDIITDGIGGGDITKARTEVYGLPVPEVVMSSVRMLQPINGYFFYDQHSYDQDDQLQRYLLIHMLQAEKEWTDNEVRKILNPLTLEDQIIRTEKECTEQYELNRKVIDDHSEVIKVPCGERILVKLLFRNRLPIDITLSKLRLEVNHQIESFQIQELQQVINGDSEQELVLEIIPKQLGSYHITNLRWNLNDQFTILQPIKKKGILLHKTIQQRASYDRTKDQQLKFQVVEAAPLISLQFEGLSPEILQGQLMKTYLILKNDGTSPAHHIYLKLSQPSFVFYLSRTTTNASKHFIDENRFPDGKFMEFYGHSCTIVNLDGIVIGPGEEIRLEAWLRLTRLGLQKICLLAAYQREELQSEKRYSYISIKTTGVPSIGLSMQVSNRVNSSHRAALITELTNTLPEEHFGTELIRLSSVGQLDLPDLEEHFIDIDSNCIKLVGLLLLGSGIPTTTVNNTGRERVVIASPTDRLSHVWPIQVLDPLLLLRQPSHDPENSSNNIQNPQHWLIPLPEIELDRSLKLSKNHLQSIVEQFLIIWYSHNEFIKKLEEARRLLLLEELEANAAGPRSIQDVRREREKLAKRVQSDDDGMETVIENKTETSSAQQQQHITFSIDNIIRKERLNNSLGVTVIWVCRWQEKIRWGMHHLPFVTMLSNLIPKEKILTNPSQYFNHSLPYLRISLSHVKEMRWKDLADRRQPLVCPVTVKIQSLSSQRSIRFSIQALPYEFSSVKEISTEASADNVLVAKMENVGFSWLGKIRHSQIVLQPKEQIVLSFDCQLLRPGVYNLNRFAIVSEFVDDDEAHLTTVTSWTPVPGTSFFTILAPSDRKQFYGQPWEEGALPETEREMSPMAIEEEISPEPLPTEATSKLLEIVESTATEKIVTVLEEDSKLAMEVTIIDTLIEPVHDKKEEDMVEITAVAVEVTQVKEELLQEESLNDIEVEEEGKDDGGDDEKFEEITTLSPIPPEGEPAIVDAMDSPKRLIQAISSEISFQGSNEGNRSDRKDSEDDTGGNNSEKVLLQEDIDQSGEFSESLHATATDDRLPGDEV